MRGLVHAQPKKRVPLRIFDNNVDGNRWGKADDASKIAAGEKTRCAHAPVLDQAIANFKRRTELF
jgi:hypothetical protein